MPDNIIAICPECQTRYSLKPDLIGKRMQCRDSSCATVFVVTTLESPAAVAPQVPQTVPDGPPELDWQSAPPPIRDDEPSWTEPPPVRKLGEPSLPAYLLPKQQPNRRSKWILALIAFVIGMVAWGTISVVRNLAQAEDRLAADAEKAYSESKFGDAAQKYKTLIEKYARGMRANEYRFLQALSETRRVANIAPADPDSAYPAINGFINEHGNSAYFAGRRADVFATVTKVFSDVITDGKDVLQSSKPELKTVDSRLQQAKQLAASAQRIAPPDVDLGPIQSKLDEFTRSLESVRETLAARQEILSLLNQDRPDLEVARKAIRKANLTNDPEILSAWQKAEEALRKSVTYHAANQPAQDKIPTSASGGIIPDTRGKPGNGSRVPAYANGLLFALEGRSGRLAWVDRVGVDVGQLPQRLAALGDEESWLVYSTEPMGLSARKSSTGAVIWFQPLERPIGGSPVIAGRRIFVALQGPQGKVLDFDAGNGQLNGSFEIGQSLSGGLAIASGTPRLFAPAIGRQVFVLDFGGDDVGIPPRCVATLNSGHAPGTLLGRPLVAPGPDGHSTLFMTVAEGVGDSSLWLIRLGDLNSAKLSIERVPLHGWSWFVPTCDAERLAWISDRGILNLMGLRRPGALDAPVYPLIDGEVRAETLNAKMQRSLIAHSDESGLIVLSNGQLRQWQLGIDRNAGRQCKPGWALPDPLGIPHAESWTDENGNIVLTTQRTDLPMTLVTAVQPDTGMVIWQRNLGLPTGLELKVIGNHIVSADSRGSITAITTLDESSKNETGWQIGGRELARPIPAIVRESWVDVSGDGMTIVGPTANGIVVRQVAKDLTVKDTKVDLPTPLAGRPGFGQDALILPLRSGQLYRLSLVDSNPRPVPGPTWRASGVAADVEGAVVHWHGNEFLVFDGSRRLLRLNWSGAADYELGTANALERNRRLIHLPGVLTGAPPRAVVADAGGTVLLLRGEQLEIERFWRLGDGQRVITQGPTVLGDRVAVIVNHRELVCLDPASAKPVWTFASSPAGLATMPVLVNEGWVVADCNGTISLLDSKTGQPKNKSGFQLTGLVAVAGPMIALGPDRVLAVLTDGSAQIITVDQLMK